MNSARDSATPREAKWPQGLILLAQQVLPTMGPLMLVPVIPLIVREYGDMPGAAYWVPSLLTVPSLCMALLAVAAGAIGDRIGRRGPLIAALSFYSIAGMAPLVLSSFSAIFASRVLLGIAEALIVTLSVTLMADYFSGARRDRWLALIGAVGSGSAVFLLALSGWLGEQFGWRAPTAVYGLGLLIVPAMLAFTWEPRRTHTASADPGETAFPWRHIIAVAVMSLIGGSFFFMVAIQQAFGLIALGIDDPAKIGVLTAISGLGTPVGSLIFRRSVAASTKTLLVWEFLLIGGGLISMGLATSDIVFAASAFGALVGAGMMMPTMMTWTIRGMPFASRSRGVGVFQSFFSAGQFASGLILPFVARNIVDGVLAAYILLGVIAVMIAAIGLVRIIVASPRRYRLKGA